MLQSNEFVMIVEDSMVQAKKLKKFLDQNGVSNIHFTTAEEALKSAINAPPILFISDVVMPGMSGYEFCTSLKNIPALKEIPVILLTSLSDPLDIIKGLQAGADNFITKPYEEKYLLARIKHLLDNKDMQNSNTSDDTLEIVFQGTKYKINSAKKQILNLLLSVYEAAIQRNIQLAQTKEELQTTNENLKAAMQELESFSYTVSHDLRSPLNIVSGYTQLLRDDYSEILDDDAKEYLQRILQSTFSMAKLIDDLLKFSRSARTAVSPEPVNISDIAEEVIKEIRERKINPKAFSHVEKEMKAMADPSLIHIVLDNLIGNAFKYSSKVEIPFITVDKIEMSRETVFFVRDNGAGFDMTESHRLFNPFQRFHSSHEFQGTGIGLATFRRIIERHGGWIWAESEPGKGAVFYFTLGC